MIITNLENKPAIQAQRQVQRQQEQTMNAMGRLASGSELNKPYIDDVPPIFISINTGFVSTNLKASTANDAIGKVDNNKRVDFKA